MAQMLLDKPLNYAISLGYNPVGYVELADTLNKIRERVTPEMHKIIEKYETDSQLKHVIQSAIPKEGSYHRSSLVYIVSSSNGNPDITLSAAAELFYWATAWLDDIADENTFRQSAQSVRHTFDDSVAMYTSNMLYGIVLRVISDKFKEEPEKLAKIINYFSRNFHVINRGQASDILMAKKNLSDVKIEDYISLIEETTGVDVACNICMGAVSAGLEEKTINHLYEFGLVLGTLAQIRDDVLDYCDVRHNNEYIIGKLPFRDIETKKKRLPLLLTGNTELMSLTDEIYDTVEQEFITPRKNEAIKNLEAAGISLESKKLLLKILNYWSDIRLFQKLAASRQTAQQPQLSYH